MKNCLIRRKKLIRQVLDLWAAYEPEFKSICKKYYNVDELTKVSYIRSFLCRCIRNPPMSSQPYGVFFTEFSRPKLISLFTRQVMLNFIRISQKEARKEIKLRGVKNFNNK
jgi:hypothetical protein